MNHLLQAAHVLGADGCLLLGCEIRVGIAIVDEILGSDDVLTVVQQDAFRVLAGPAGTSRLLIIGLQRGGDVVVDDQTDIRTVDSHPERIGRDQNRTGIGHETVLHLGSFFVAHSRVIGEESELRVELLHGFPRGGVDDGRNLFPEKIFQRPVLVLRPGTAENRKREIRTLEAGNPKFHLRPVKLPENVLADLCRGGGGKCADLRNGKLFHNLSETRIGGPEVVSPLADAVRFVDHHDLRRISPEKVSEGFRLKPFRRNIEQFEVAQVHVAQDLVLFRRRDRRVDAGGRDPFPAQGVHLVLHQGDQRRDHDSVSVLQQNRQLVAERLPRPGRHDDAEVFAGMNLLYNLLLVVQKGVEAEIALQCLVQNPAHDDPSLLKRKYTTFFEKVQGKTVALFGIFRRSLSTLCKSSEHVNSGGRRREVFRLFRESSPSGRLESLP